MLGSFVQAGTDPCTAPAVIANVGSLCMWAGARDASVSIALDHSRHIIANHNSLQRQWQSPGHCSCTWFPAHPSSKQVNAPALLMPPVLPPALLPAHGLIKTHHQPTMIQAVQANLGHCLCTCLLTHPNSKQVDARTLLAVLRVPSKVGVHCREGRLRVLLRRKGDARAAVGAVLPRYKRTCMAVPQRAEVVRCISG